MKFVQDFKSHLKTEIIALVKINEPSLQNLHI